MNYKVFRGGECFQQKVPCSKFELQNELKEIMPQFFLGEPGLLDERIEVFDRLGLLMESVSPLRSQMLSYFESAGMSKYDQEYFVKTVRTYLSPCNLKSRWERAFGNDVNIFPAGLVGHIGATNTILGGLDGLIDGLIAGNFNIFKLPTPEGGFPGLFFEALFSIDKNNVLKKNIYAFWWQGGDHSIETILKNHLDRVVVWGGSEAILSWKKDLPVQAQILAHGPKYGIGVITKLGFDSSDLQELARAIAWDVSSWDQRACNSLQSLFIESRIEKHRLHEFIKILGNELDTMALAIPPVRDSDDFVEILKARELSTAEEIINNKLIQTKGQTWTINCWQKWSSGLIPSCLNRFLQILPFENFDHLIKGLYPERVWLQTLGHCASEVELSMIHAKMGKIGLSRVCPLGKMPSPHGSEPHDGNFDLRLLTCMMASK